MPTHAYDIERDRRLYAKARLLVHTDERLAAMVRALERLSAEISAGAEKQLRIQDEYAKVEREVLEWVDRTPVWPYRGSLKEYCPHCGEELQRMSPDSISVCPDHGVQEHRDSDGATYCSYCGHEAHTDRSRKGLPCGEEDFQHHPCSCSRHV